MTVSGHNMAYWMSHPLERDDIWVLNEIKKGHKLRDERYQFHVAYLIAEECLDWNEDTGELSLTEKGEDALDFFKEDYPWAGR